VKIVLANIDYLQHMTDEGNQLQLGLQNAGWKLVGVGYDGCTDVSMLIANYQPSAIFVQDKRDLDPNCGAFRKDLMFKGLGNLKTCSAKKIAVVKDAGTLVQYHERFCSEVGADAVYIYYHEKSVTALSPWLAKYQLLRGYHTIDTDFVSKIPITTERYYAVGSGAMNATVYPLRVMAQRNRNTLGLKWLAHPGYHNNATHTRNYLTTIAQYKVHLATASAYGFALRKIIESVAVGTTVVTNLPEYDRLPEIDEALVRVPDNIMLSTLRDVIATAAENWDLGRALHYANKARAFYDYRIAGLRLDSAIAGL